MNTTNKWKTLYLSNSVYDKLKNTTVTFHWLEAKTHVQKIEFLLSYYNDTK